MKVGLALMTDEDSSSGRTGLPSYQRIRDFALQTEEAGFDSIWLYDHLLFRSPGKETELAWEGWTLLSALAEATERIELGTLVACAQYRNPALLAHMATTLEEVSRGRLILGLGAGWNEPEFDALGIPFDHKVDRFEEALQIIVPLLRVGGVTFEGKHYRALDCEVVHRDTGRHGPPILIAALQPRMMRLAARYADMWNFGLWADLPAMRARMQMVCAEVGRDFTTLEVTHIRYAAFLDLSEGADRVHPYVTGTAQAIAAELRSYEEDGVAHVMFDLIPNSQEALDRVAEALKLYRSGCQ